MANKNLYVTWDQDGTGKEKAFAAAGRAIAESEPILHHTAGSDIFQNVLPNISIRDAMSRRDYENYRPEEAVPDDRKKAMALCMKAYRRTGLIHNVIDLMGDFTVQGVGLTHPNPNVEKWGQMWWRKTHMSERCERFANLLYRTGNVFVQRTTAKVPVRVAEDLHRSLADADIEVEVDEKIERRVIPWKYRFLNPLKVEPIGDELALFVGDINYGIAVPPHVANKIKNPKNALEKRLIGNLSPEMVRQIRKGDKVIPFDTTKVSNYHYKKDDWEFWADSIIAPVLSDLIVFEKLKLADLAALDGAISHIRIWKLGDMKERILPTREAIARLSEMLLHNVGGGAIDLIWGPDLQIDETGTEIYKFLGNEKYGPTLNNLYAGIGIPPTLTGGTNAGGFTNNFISLQTLIERLVYGRMILAMWVLQELRYIQKAMNFRKPFGLRFDRLILSDQSAEKALLVQLVDRGIISEKTVQERFGELPELEELRNKREWRERKRGTRPRKASQWHNPEQEEALQKIALQTGVVAPSEVGLELQEAKPGEKRALDIKADQAAKQAAQKSTGIPGQGRPKNSKDKQKRKQKRVLPRSKAAAASFMESVTWARKAYDDIDKEITSNFLQAKAKKNIRSLSEKEFSQYERLKFALLSNLNLYETANTDTIGNLVQKNDLRVIPAIDAVYKATAAKFVEKYNKQPTTEQLREMQINTVALFKGDYDGKSSNDS